MIDWLLSLPEPVAALFLFAAALVSMVCCVASGAVLAGFLGYGHRGQAPGEPALHPRDLIGTYCGAATYQGPCAHLLRQVAGGANGMHDFRCKGGHVIRYYDLGDGGLQVCRQRQLEQPAPAPEPPAGDHTRASGEEDPLSGRRVAGRDGSPGRRLEGMGGEVA